ncbi:hypothetical protein BO94DRAFT_607606 [Aspergillus sclerotioniger CBS 115572]|uniref:Zn(2)-C6 fungal-type domain-containing protein n=1 Tax=Aspergillus sclerotioniger CBS 115572 TaxID=1450535 RepID=A0A317VFG0_9EURO|nr:hypothetical protein BO94DRAFT_607606 [Aspergillus sclerotioniger CBS 115572]PWY73123.1 hypothetical protein BO94DRAFT_607606 [Aspergillus sclerotioniger CBS 115572]
MPRVAPEDRKRVYYPKTRTGCLTCKSVPQRRIKCGEERPACLRCTSTGRQCDGYRDPASHPSPSNVSARPLLARPLSTYHSLACDQERRSFQFFLEKTVPQLAGDFECAFWGRLLLQSVHHEPVIRHATVALGSLHEHFNCDAAPFRLGTDSPHTSFALRQYLRAMRCLMPTPSHSQPLDIYLISCILFACFEAMRDYYGPAITHITSGLNILSEIRNPSSTSTPLCIGRTPYVPIDILCGLFTRLQGQVIVTVHRIGAARCNLWPELVINLDQPIVFQSLADARETLEIYTYYYRQRSTELLYQTHPTDTTTTINPAITLRDTSLILLSHWSTALDTFLQQHTTILTPRERRAASVLQLRKIDCFVALDILQAAGEAEAGHHVQWDKYCPFFEQMVALGESIIPPPSSATKKTFSLDLSIIAAIFNVAVRCRDPVIRRRAVSVLRASAIQEGVWNSVVVAAIADKWIEIEEEGLGEVRCCADVPDEARLADFMPVFDVERPRAEVYFSWGEEKGRARGRGVRREVFTW